MNCFSFFCGNIRSMLAPVSALLLVSCVDGSRSYDDISRVLGVDVDGLSAPLGSTEQIFLRDFIDTDDHLKTDASGVYYVVQDGKVDGRFTAPSPSVSQKLPTIRIGTDFGAAFGRARQADLPGTTAATGQSAPPSPRFVPFAEEAAIPVRPEATKGLVSITAVRLRPTRLNLVLRLDDADKNALDIYGWRNVTVTLPDYVASRRLSNHKLTIADRNFPNGIKRSELSELVIDSLDFRTGAATDREIDGKIRIEGELKVGPSKGSTPTDMAHAYATLLLTAGGESGNVQLELERVTGVFDPEVKLEDSEVSMWELVPDFLRDAQTKLTPTRVSVRIDTDLRQSPARFTMRGLRITAENEGTPLRQMTVAPDGVTLRKQATQTFYFYEGYAPYESAGEPAADAERVSTPGLGRLFTQIPEKVKLKLSENVLSMDPDIITLAPGHTYTAQMHYRLQVPLEFDKGLHLSYEYVSDSIGDGLKEVHNDRLKADISGIVVSTIPMDLAIAIEGIDAKGTLIKELSAEPVQVEAANGSERETPVRFTLQASDPQALQRLARLRYRFLATTASAGNSTVPLRSDQYIRLKEVKMSLSGKVITHF